MASGMGLEGEVWRMDLDHLDVNPAADEAFEDFERARLARLRFARDVQRYRAAHWGLRRVLAQALGRAPVLLRLRQGATGKPVLHEGGALRFNLSHSGGIGVVAWCRGHEVGVDVECRRPLAEVEALAAGLLSADETRQWQTLDSSARPDAFLVAWTRKEAAAKALGAGLAIEPRDIDVGLDPRPRRWPRGEAEVQLASTRLDADSVVSLAWQCDAA